MTNKFEDMLREVVRGGYLDRSPNQKSRVLGLLEESDHYHEAKYIGGELVRECNRCGEDLMHRSHVCQN